MSQNDSVREVACTLTEKQEAKRSTEVESLLISHYLGYKALEDGLEIRFEGTDEALQTLAQFTSDELQCCSFAEYEITVSPPYEETALTVTGPEDTRRMFQAGLVEQLESASA